MAMGEDGSDGGAGGGAAVRGTLGSGVDTCGGKGVGGRQGEGGGAGGAGAGSVAGAGAVGKGRKDVEVRGRGAGAGRGVGMGNAGTGKPTDGREGPSYAFDIGGFGDDLAHPDHPRSLWAR